MTLEQLKENLEKCSPFKFKGSDDIYKFKEGQLSINDNPFGPYSVATGENGFYIETKGLFVFHKNVKIDLGQLGEVIINFDQQGLSTYPLDKRHPSAIDGYLILIMTQIKE